MATRVNWKEAIKPLIKAYSKKKFPLEYKNTYQLMVMVLLAAQDSDKNVNKIAPAFFKAYPNLEALAKAKAKDLHSLLRVRNFANKSNWLEGIAKQLKKNRNIPLTLDELTELPGIGRKSANVILRESGKPPEGVIVDIHVVRVAPRLGIATGMDPKKIEKQIMEELPPKEWEAGMSMSFHGREICRPRPLCEICFMRKVCAYYQKFVKKA